MTNVSIENLWKSWGDVHAIRGANLEIESGEFLTLLGESGCGKTTTLRSIAGLEKPSSGAIRIGDRPVFDSGSRIDVAIEKRDVGMVFQSYALWPHMTVLGNVMFPLRQRKQNARASRKRALEVLEIVGLEHLSTRAASALSGGQQQRVALARAIAARPQVLLYDEPLSNLDPSLRRSMRDEIHTLHRLGGTTSVYVTHDLEEAMHLSDRVVVMQHGLLEQVAPPEAIYGAPATEYVARFVGFENVLPATVISSAGEEHMVRIPGLGDAVLPVRQKNVDTFRPLMYAVRGSNLTVGPIDAHPAHSVEGAIERIVYLGERTELDVRVASSLLTIAVSEQDAYRLQGLLAVGRIVSVTPAEGMARLVTRAEGAPVDEPVESTSDELADVGVVS